MPKHLTEEQVEQYHRDGFLSPVRVISEDAAVALRQQLEAFEAAQALLLERLGSVTLEQLASEFERRYRPC